jgi:hypothetical protein
MRTGSLQARPKKVTPAGRIPPRVYPIGTLIAGKPVVGEKTLRVEREQARLVAGVMAQAGSATGRQVGTAGKMPAATKAKDIKKDNEQR